jgi:RHS repeat-associated protein
MGRITANTYNSFSETLTKQDPLQVTTTTTYTSTGDIATTSRPLIGTQQIQTTTWTYGDAQHPGDATSMTDPDNHVWTYTYDTYGNQTAVTDPLGDKTTHAFDGVGRMTSMVTPNGNVSGGHPANFTWSYTFDAFGNRLTVTDPLSHKVTYRYDANQNLTQTTDPDNNVTTTVYDADNEPTQSKRADSPQTTVLTDYNADGTVLDEKDGKGNPILTFGYNALAQRTSRTDVLGNITTYTYDGVGNLITKQDPGGNCLASPPTSCTTYLYDSANQITAVTYSDGVTPNVTVKYDSGGQRTSETDGTGTSFWSWDSLHRPVSYTNGNGAQVQWIYNLRDLPLTITYPGSLNVTEVYDNAGRWTSVTDWTSNTTTFGYDANSNLTKETFPTTSGVIDTLTFNNADHMTAVSSKKGNSTLFSATYTRDAANQLTGDTSAASGTSKYKYDALNQVCYAGSTNTNACSTPPTGSIAYKYDAADNLTQNGSTQQQSFNNADELCWTSSTSGSCSSPPSGSSTYQYDLRGNRTSFNPNAGQAQTFTFDQAGHLASFTVGSSTTTYGYNSDGLRLCKVAGSSSAPCASQSADQFVWDTVDGDIVKDGSTLYVYGPGNLPVEQINGSTTYYFHHDQIGSTRLITTSAGASQATYTFNPYGKLVASTGSATNPFLFAGQFQDSESLNYYLRARYYDPTTGQFLSRDPATASTREPYGYVSDSPLNGTDPSGLDAYPCIEHIGPFPIIGICQGQQPGGGQFPIHAQPQPSPSPEPSPTPVQLRDCGCQVELRPMGAGEPALNLVVSNAGEEIDWVDFQVIGGGPVGTLNAREWIISGRMLGEGNFAATTVDTAGWGSGLFFAMAVATVTLVDGEKCLPAESLTVPLQQEVQDPETFM